MNDAFQVWGRRSILSLFIWILTTLSPPVHAQSNAPEYVANPSVAINLRGIRDWTTQHPFINVAKTARPWFGHLDGRWGGITNEQLRATGHVNENGWPVGIPANATKLETLIFTNQPKDLMSNRGVYRITYSGDVDIDLNKSVRELRRNPGEIWFEFPESSAGTIGISLTRINPIDPLTKLDIIHEDNIQAFEVGAKFNPVWLDLIKDFRVLRFMNWLETNNSEISTWEDMPKLNDFTYVHGVPLSIMIELSNLVGADPWLTLPHMSNDDLVQRFAEQVERELYDRRKAYIEYSNEFWNFQFEQTRWADAQAKSLWGSRAGGDAWIQFGGLRAAQVALIFDDVFEGESRDRLINVAAFHFARPHLVEAQLSGKLLKRESDHDPKDVFDAHAVTGYLNLDLDHSTVVETLTTWLDEGGKEHLFDMMSAQIRNNRLKNLREFYWPEFAEIAKDMDADLIMYEGGTHVVLHGGANVSDELRNLLYEFNYSSQMTELYKETFDAWRESRGHLFNAFVDVSQNANSGSWGHLRHLDDETERWDALMAENQRPARFDIDRPERAFGHGVFHGSEIGTQFDDILIGTDGDDSFKSTVGLDRVHGGKGFDQLIMQSAIDDYQFSKSSDLFVAMSEQSTIHFIDIEYLVFPIDGMALVPQDLVQ